MGIYLNSSNAYLNYRRTAKSAFFVDKTNMIEELLTSMEQNNRWLCFTRPRRFGKSVMANMVAAYFSGAHDSSGIFDQLEISKSAKYREHLNQHQVIHIDFSRTPQDCDSYRQYIAAVRDGILTDIKLHFPETELGQNESPWDALEKTHQTFIFVLDEWDAVFHMDFMTEKEKGRYLLFLKNLLKDRAYVDLAYMTGVLPIAKYSSGSELNMFVEYSMIGRKRYSEYFGFSGHEVDQLYEIYQKNVEKAKFTREELRLWYDGYYNALDERLYNPRSIVCALANNELSNYWTSSGPYDEVFYYIKNNIDDVREEVTLMVSGECVPARVQEYAATAQELRTKNQIYSAMVVYGLLTYYDGEVLIPNKELMDKFDELLLEKQELGYIHQLAERSKTMLKATLEGDTDTMAEIMDFAHNTESPILQYNSEVELAAVVNLVYLAARDKYRVVREEKTGKGFADFLFYPYRTNRACMILELKMNDSPEEAIRQIREKQYALNFIKENQYAGQILLVGIGYDSKSKAHSCKVEVLSMALDLTP